MAKIENPVIRGFNPDPSICRVGDDYYIATSTFEWFPGIQIHHSKDLVNWRLLTRALTTTKHLDMRGYDNSCGVYAPALSYSDGRFWLTYSNVASCQGFSWMSTPCFVTTAENIEGPWTEPVSINNFGFDPSFFHDDDGKKYMVNMVWDGRSGRNKFGGIVVREFDVEQQKPVGPIHNVFSGTNLKFTEGPQILKKDGYYYLITAEGGTNWSHAVTVCRSKNILGPYEVHPENPVLTSRFKEHAELQRAGHGFFVETQGGEWYLSHLCGRPIKNPEAYPYLDEYASGFCILGRETALQKVEWRDDWPYLACGGNTPQVVVDGPDLPLHPWPEEKLRDDFDQDELNKHFQTLREPVDESWCSLKARPGHLRLKGRQYLYSMFEQSLIARRIQSHTMMAETCVEFAPELPHQMAGLVAYYNRGNHYFCRISADDDGKKVLKIVHFINDQYGEVGDDIDIDGIDKVYLRLELDVQYFQFSWSADGKSWNPVGPKLNSTPLSDEFGDSIFRFTGAFVGLFAADVAGLEADADFEYFDYKEL